MKERFTTIDLFSVLQDLRQSLIGMRVANVYDIDQKTYLIKLAKPEVKTVLLFESGCRIHTTEFEWPKSMQPSGFSMKLRKHLRTRRLVAITQLGVDRVVDLQFGSNEAAYHLIIELYDRGNVILTDCNHMILSLLRTRTDTDAEVRFAVREPFSQETIKREQPLPTRDQLQEILSAAKPGDHLKHALNPHFVYGAALLSHCLLGAGISDSAKIGSGFNSEDDFDKLVAAMEEADSLFRRLKDDQSKGIIIQKREARPQVDTASASGEGEGDMFTNVEFHPMLFRQHEKCPYKEFPTLSKAVDEFFSTKSSQRQDLKTLQVQRAAVKKLDNIRRDHEKRITDLQRKQEKDMHLAQLIEMNIELVERACLVIRSAIANAMDWGDIELLVKEAQARGDPVASAIHGLKLSSNEITLLLRDPIEEEENGSEEERVRHKSKQHRGVKVDIDLGLSAFSNARRYYDHKKQAAKKEQKTLDASGKALKSAEKKTKQSLKDASVVAKIKKARKVHWFEKFLWFISSENYMVIGGRDQQQNELVVKRYLRDGDVYVHADLHGSPSVIIKNPHGGPVPPRTLNEAGSMAVCYSSAWEARIITSAWWVYNHQVSKTAPTGEYLTPGSFMIRGKKNFLPPCQLTLGFGFLFKVDESCIPLHLHERKIREKEDDEAELKKQKQKQRGTHSDQAGSSPAPERTKRQPRPQPQAEEQPPQTKRGQKSKQKKIREKYRDQDEEERQLRMDILASARPSKQLPEKKPGKKQKKDPNLSTNPKHKYHQKAKGKGHGQSPLVETSHKQMSPLFLTSAVAPHGKENSSAPMPGEPSEEPEIVEEEEEIDAVVESRKENGEESEEGEERAEEAEETEERAAEGREEGEREEVAVGQEMYKEEGTKGKQEEKKEGTKEEEKREEKKEEEGEEMSREATVPEELPQLVVRDSADQLVPKETSSSDQGQSDSTHGAGGAGSEATTAELSHGDGEQVEGEDSDEEKKAVLAEENIQQLEESEKDQLSALDSFTGCPVSEDILLYAIPVCAPYTATVSYKYRVKLVPGNNKRGKAARAALHRFIQSREASQREKDLLKSVKDNDLSRYIPGKVKMALPQAHKQSHR